jgi:hypothetical protein
MTLRVRSTNGVRGGAAAVERSTPGWSCADGGVSVRCFPSSNGPIAGHYFFRIFDCCSHTAGGLWSDELAAVLVSSAYNPP